LLLSYYHHLGDGLRYLTNYFCFLKCLSFRAKRACQANGMRNLYHFIYFQEIAHAFGLAGASLRSSQ